MSLLSPSITIPEIALRIIARFCPYDTAKHFRQTCKLYHTAILPYDIREAKFSSLFFADPLKCFLFMAKRGQLGYMERTPACYPPLDKNTVYHYAIREATLGNQTETVTYLLTLVEKPFKPTGYICDFHGSNYSPIHFAASEGYMEVSTFEQHDADGPCNVLLCSPKRSPGGTALHTVAADALFGCVNGDDPSLAEYVIQSAFGVGDVDLYNAEHLMQWAIETSNLESVKLLLGRGISVGLEHMQHAFGEGSLEMVQLLLDLGSGLHVEVLNHLVLNSVYSGRNPCAELVCRHAQSKGFDVSVPLIEDLE
ncbi:hypothetical protein HK097_001389 [Rhizophlyctis rosea]|uniref:Uncharacterized protein n=1 Tax=Rhizophlyctis rosea TaxID=64517 RepID=A0AAD5S7A6_9FUNG|nr:hypothetical protein HK097_001389 [Rhizophlyctis rosea]